jgi:hypothetical protein
VKSLDAYLPSYEFATRLRVVATMVPRATVVEDASVEGIVLSVTAKRRAEAAT